MADEKIVDAPKTQDAPKPQAAPNVQIAEEKVDVQEFIANKLGILNKKQGAKFERLASQVIQNNFTEAK